MRMGWVQSGGILLGLGLMFCALGGEGLAIFNACIANPTCIASETTTDLYEPLVALLAGIALSVAGIVALLLGLRLAPRVRAEDARRGDPVVLVRPHRP
jgi:hypothetical protein